MGYIRHHAIICTSGDVKAANYAHSKASGLFPVVSGVLHSPTNRYATFLIPPDGSKEGWETSDAGDRAREEFKQWLKWQKSLGVYVDWAEIQYGDDEHETKIVSHSDEDSEDSEECVDAAKISAAAPAKWKNELRCGHVVYSDYLVKIGRAHV